MKSFYLTTKDNKKIHVVDFCENLKNPKLILQICHGMAEHIQRYENFSKFLEESGIKVLGLDNRGHGKSTEDDLFGHICDKNGDKKVILDVVLLNQYIKKNFQNKKIILFGHSMGSMIVRSFLNSYSDKIDGCIICGTCAPFSLKHNIFLFIAKSFSYIFGKKKKSKFLNSLAFMGYNKKIKNKKTDFDWLTSNEEEVYKYNLDKRCGFFCTNQFFVDLLNLIKDISQKENIKNIDKNLPLFFISGSLDPVGEYKKGVLKSFKLYKEENLNANLKFYKNLRHEILNEVNNKIVYLDILNFLKNI